MILVHILSRFQPLKVMISTARPLGQDVEVGRYELAATTANAGWASSAYTQYGY